MHLKPLLLFTFKLLCHIDLICLLHVLYSWHCAYAASSVIVCLFAFGGVCLLNCGCCVLIYTSLAWLLAFIKIYRKVLQAMHKHTQRERERDMQLVGLAVFLFIYIEYTCECVCVFAVLSQSVCVCVWVEVWFLHSKLVMSFTAALWWLAKLSACCICGLAKWTEGGGLAPTRGRGGKGQDAQTLKKKRSRKTRQGCLGLAAAAVVALALLFCCYCWAFV